jgi:glucose-1-phosphate thymidylyltransferase
MTPVRKAVVLAAGRGSRMRQPAEEASLDAAQAAAADAGWKGMVPIAGRPFLDYVLSGLADAGQTDVCVVVGPGQDAIRAHYASRPPQRLRLAFAVQEAPRGTADALLAAEGFADEEFLALNSDNLYPLGALRALGNLGQPGLPVFEREKLLAESNFPRERVASYATLSVGADGFLRRIVEKPDEKDAAAAAGEVLLSMNLWRFSSRIFEACRRVPISARGERELPQAVGWAIKHLDERFRTVRCDEGVLDLTTRADVAAVARRLRGIEPCP